MPRLISRLGGAVVAAAVAAGSLLAAAPAAYAASAVEQRPILRHGDSSVAVEWVERRLRMSGADTYYSARTERYVKQFQSEQGLHRSGRVSWRTWKKLNGRPGSLGDRVEGLNWWSLARCESGNDPTAVSASGRYHGLYQFDRSTWGSVGGIGVASNKSAQQQTYRAKLLYLQRSDGPWPVCGRHLYD